MYLNIYIYSLISWIRLFIWVYKYMYILSKKLDSYIYIYIYIKLNARVMSSCRWYSIPLWQHYKVTVNTLSNFSSHLSWRKNPYNQKYRNWCGYIILWPSGKISLGATDTLSQVKGGPQMAPPVSFWVLWWITVVILIISVLLC